MAAAIVIDVAWAQPTVAQIKATGATGVLRYFSTDASKNLTAAHVKAYSAAGLAIGTVYESTAARATAGFAAGVADAQSAEAQRKTVGLPDGHRHFFAVDEDVPWASVLAYFQGAVSVLGMGRCGAYGSYAVVEGAYAYGIRLLWQTVAWSAGKVSAHAVLYQSGGTVLGGGADTNKIMAADWGQTPNPEDDMPLTPTDIAAIWAHPVTHQKFTISDAATVQTGTVLGWLDFERKTTAAALTAQLTAQGKQLAALSAAVAALAAQVGKGEDSAVIVAAVQAAIAKAVIHVEVDGVAGS